MLTRLLSRGGALLTLLVLLLAGGPARATHLLGGEMTYRYLDNTGPAAAPYRYEITVTVYNNCGSVGITAPRASASVGIYDQATGSRIVLTALNFPTTRTLGGQDGMMSIPSTSVSACIAPAVPPGCTITGVSQPYILQKFVGVVNLPAASKGYYALFTDGNRNVDITNLYNPNSQAMTLYVAMTPPAIPNHSPVFSDVAVAIICANDTTFLLNNAVDADGDRLAYTFGQPYANPGGTGGLPLYYFLPPPSLASYNPGYGYSPTTPFGTGAGNFALLDPSTGLAKYGASMAGSKYVVAVDVQEYRTIAGQEVLIGVTRRDLQLVVANCPPADAPKLPTVSLLPRDYTVEAGNTLTIPITATQDANHALDMTLNSVLLDGAGGYAATLNGDPGTRPPGNPTGTSLVSGTNGSVTGTFVFTPGCADARTTPYDVAVTVKDKGCAGKTIADVLHITVTKYQGPTAISGDQLVCELNATRTYLATGGTAPQLTWHVVGGTIIGSPTANPIQVHWGGAGTGSLSVKGSTKFGCQLDSVTEQITIAPPAALTATGKLTICQGSSTTLTVAGGGKAPYTASGGASPITGTGNTITVSPTATTTYTITDAAAPNSCTIGQVTVTVLPIPAANVGPASPSTCPGEPVSLGAPAVPGSTYSWSPSTGLSSPTVANPTLTLTNATAAPITATYTLTETSSNGCQTTNRVTVTVNPLPVAQAGAATTICAGGSGQLGAAPVAGYTYSWSPATGLSNTTVANPTVTLPNATSSPINQTYTLTVTNPATGCVNTAAVVVAVSPPLVAVAGAAATICSGSSAGLGARAVLGLTYSWSPGTGLSSTTVANPTVTLTNTTAAATTQVYTLTVSNTAGCTGTATVAVTVNPLPVAVAGAALTTCSGSPTPLGAPAVAGYTYSWSPSTGLSSPTVANPTLTLTNATAAPTTQTYTLTVTNPATGCSNTDTVVVTVNPPLAAGTIDGAQAVCPGSAPTALTSTTGASGGGPPYTYQWESSPDNATWTPIAGATSAGYAPGPLTAATYYRRQAVAALCGSAYSNVVAVQLQTPLVSGVALATPPMQCAGTAFTFTPTPSNAGTAPTYRWFVNNILVASTGATYTSTTLHDGDQVQVELTPTAGFCATGPATATVTVHLTPVALPAVTTTLQTPLPVCPGELITFSLGQATNPSASPQYQWQVDGQDVPGATGPVFTSTTLKDGQTVTLLLRAATACGVVTATSGGVLIHLNPVADVDAGPAKTIMEGDQVALEGKASGPYPVRWTPALGLTFVGTDQLHPLASPTVTTTYVLSAGGGHCADSSAVTVTVTPRVRIPNAISPNGDGQDDTWEIDNIGVYAGNHVQVFNRWGSKIFDASNYSRSTEWNGTIGGQPAPVGTYYYVITLGNGKSYSGPITVVY